MKKNILVWVIILSGILISWVKADCLPAEDIIRCSIWWETYTSTCSGWSDTSSWYMPIAYQGECKNTETLDEKSKTIISDFLYKSFTKKGYIESETDTYYTLTDKGEEYIQNALFPVIQSIITKEIKKSSPDNKKIAILNHFASLVGYDYYIKK